MKRIDSVNFRPEGDGQDLAVVRIKPDQAKVYASGVLRVMAAAYERQFEAADDDDAATGQLAPGAARRQFDASRPSKVIEQAQRMAVYMREGSSYWAAYRSRYHEPGEDMLGVAKTSPSRANLWQKIHVAKPNCYINDIASVEPRRGVASALLYVALGDYADDRTVVADVLPGTDGFFRAIDFHAGQPVGDLEIDGSLLSQTRYEAPAAGVVRAALAFRDPWLGSGTTFSA